MTVLVTSVKELVTSVKVLVTLGKTKPGFLREHVNCTKVCLANGSCLDVKDLSEWVLHEVIFIWIPWVKSLSGCQDATANPERNRVIGDAVTDEYVS